jgi:hypothetical protein
MSEIIRVSHSSIRSLQSCPRKHHFTTDLRLFPVNGSIAMRYGSGYHIGMEAYYKSNKNVAVAMEAIATFWQKPTVQIYNEDYRNLESLLTSLTLYNEQYKNDLEVVSGVPENKIVTEILLRKEEFDCYGNIIVNFVAVIDLILEVDGMKWVVDFKTTSVDLAYMASRMRKMPQLMGYQFVAQDKFDGIAGCLVYYHQLKASKSRTTGLYGATKTDFMKFPEIFNQQDYENWRKYVIWNAFQLKKAKEAGNPPNYNSCYEFNFACPYLPFCDYPRYDEDKFLEMDGFVVVPDERVEVMADAI